MSERINIYTDGSSLGNPGPGGYAIIMEWRGMDYIKEFSVGFRLTTNNRMELLAVIVALETLKKQSMKVVVYSDSKYVIDAVEKKWVFNWEKKGFKNKKNPDLWIRFLNIYNKHFIKFFWVKGHSSNPLNERCDTLAVEASKSLELSIDAEYDK